MKANLLLLLSLLCLATGCEKEEPVVTIYYPGEMLYGSMYAKKNGKEWAASPVAFNYDNIPSFFYISSGTFSEEGSLREELRFSKIPKEAGKYSVNGNTSNDFDGFVSASYYILEDDGVAGDRYEVNEGASDNYLEVTQIDTVAGIVKGNFTVSFKIATDGGKRDPNNPNKVKLSEGSFDMTFFQ